MKKIGLFLFLLVFLSACSGIQTRRGGQPQDGRSDGPFSDTPETTEQEESKEHLGDQYISTRKKPKVAVVLGPGAFKTFAYPSFLKAFAQSGVNIEEIVGIEWGALSAAFYASNGKPHEAEWKVFKLKEENIEDSSFFGGDKSVKVSSFRQYLKTNLGSANMNSTTIPFNCPLLKMRRGTVDWGRRGQLWRRVEACLASPPNFEPVDDSAPSLFAIEQAAKNLQRKGYEVIVLVNVLGADESISKSVNSWVSRAYWGEARRHIWQAKPYFTDIIEIDTSRYGPFDFKAKTGLKGVGERAGQEAAKRLVEKYKF